MKRNDMVIEIGCEDLPSWTGSYLRSKWIPFLEKTLKENRIDYTSLRFFCSLRRIILYFSDIPGVQSDITTEISGPSVEAGIDGDGNYTTAAKGFASSHKKGVEDLVVREKKGKKVLVLVKKEKGLPVEEIIGGIIVESMRKTEMPRAMKWQSEGFRFIRPVRWILALMAGKTVKMEIGGVKSGKYSYGHRVLSPGKFKLSSPADYLDKILKKHVIFDSDLRLEFVRAKLEKDFPPGIRLDEKHLREITDTVEYPVPVKCFLKDAYMELPPEVVGSVIRKLKGVPLFSATGALNPFYLTVIDGPERDEIRENYQNVLASKMDDAMFFMKQDLSTPFAGYVESLKKISYHPKWGSIYDRVSRFREIAGAFFSSVDLPEKKRDDISAILSLCKNDLATLMVAEFPDLEGIIGRIYAEKSGLSDTVCRGIEQHYWPRSPGGKLPETTEASISSLIVRIESLCGMFLDNVEIKGTGDPYGIKKIANGLIEIIWNGKKPVPVGEIVSKSLKTFSAGADGTEEKIISFILQRVDNLLAGEGLSPGIRKAVISTEGDNLLNIRLKADALKTFFGRGDGQNILVPFIRVANILKQAGEKNVDVNPSVEENLFSEEMEIELYGFFKNNEKLLKDLYSEKSYGDFLESLGSWREIIDKFFDEILVMAENDKVRGNRLALLKQINDIFSLFADFSLIPIAEVDNA